MSRGGRRSIEKSVNLWTFTDLPYMLAPPEATKPHEKDCVAHVTDGQKHIQPLVYRKPFSRNWLPLKALVTLLLLDSSPERTDISSILRKKLQETPELDQYPDNMTDLCSSTMTARLKKYFVDGCIWQKAYYSRVPSPRK